MSVKIFSSSKSIYLAEKISESYGIDLSSSDFKVFSDGEFCHGLNESVRGDKVFIVSSLYSSYNEADKIFDIFF
jgi:ribose-phosphate pyrophosphokinase